MRDRPEFLVDELTQIIGVIGRIHDDMFGLRQPLEQAARLWAIPLLARRDRETDRQTERIDRSMVPGRQPAAGSADCGSFKPPF